MHTRQLFQLLTPASQAQKVLCTCNWPKHGAKTHEHTRCQIMAQICRVYFSLCLCTKPVPKPNRQPWP